jgi:hypothetical protein
MSILNRPGWANRSFINEGRLHSDELKQRITNLFVRTSLGNSPTYVVSKISDILRQEKGDDIDINDIVDEDIIRIANDPQVTNGKFKPELKSSIADARMETEDQMSGLDSGLPSEQGEDHSDSESEDVDNEDNHENSYEDEDEENCEDCESQRPSDEKPIDFVIKKENAKLSPKSVDKLLRENYLKSKQHKYLIEERYRRM